ncbi:MAG: hypothetical protein ACFFCS_01930 [Candidatus Hodarchaeota archaeon]
MGASMYFWITGFITFALGGKTTSTYLHGRDKRTKKPEESYQQDEKPKLILDEETGGFEIKFGEKKSLKNCQPRVKIEGKTYSIYTNEKNNRLELKSLNIKKNGESELGKVLETTIEWLIPGLNEKFIGKILEGIDAPFIQFKLIIPRALEFKKKGKFKEPVVEFPHFINESANEHVLSWANHKFAPPRRKFDFAAAPVVLYDDQLNAFMFSTLDSFFVTGIKKDKKTNAISCGLAGTVEKTPENFSLESLLCFDKGINRIVEGWGALFRKRHGGEIRDPYSSPITAYLGYNTDNGACYYYNTEKGMNYEETMIAVSDHHKEIGLPMGYYELDSWWYPKSYEKLPGLLKVFLFGSAMHWGEPPKKDIFPNGLKHLWDKLDNKPLMCHSRWFSPMSHYVNEYDFYVQKASWKSFWQPLFAAPKNQDFWDDLFKACKEWGLSCYLQDWLSYQYDEIDVMKSTVDFADKWTRYMGKGAEKQGMTLQYCMAPSSFMMQAVKIPNVMQARASDDHNGMQTRRWYHPHFTQTSMLCNAIGFLPHKDTFFSSRKKLFWYYRERNPKMECLAAALSAGPVAPSDKLGNEDVELLMKTCRSDGLLLKPDKPATVIDLMFKEHAKYYASSTHSKKPSGLTWYYLHLTNLWASRVKDKTFTLDDLEITGEYLAYFFEEKKMQVLDSTSDKMEFNLKKEGQELAIMCPKLLDGVYLVGNPEKFVTCASKQVINVLVDDAARNITVEVENVPGEPVPLLFHSGKKPAKVNGNDGDVAYKEEDKMLRVNVKLDTKGKGNLILSF